jgi:D-glycero-D-manno-heptose 1,7-bisphosphate phosphatase
MTRKAVLLDRDGIINQPIIINGKPFPPSSLSEFELVDSIGVCLDLLRNRGYLLIIFTNQPDVARGKTRAAEVEGLHEFVRKRLPIDKIYSCYHDNSDNCECRKPKPGMIHKAEKDFDLDLSQCFVVGDRWRDIDAGTSAGCMTIFVDYGYDENLRKKPDYTVNKVLEITNIIQ